MSIQADYRGYVSGSARCVYSGGGVLLLVLASHSEATAQSVTLYDNNKPEGDILLKVNVSSELGLVHLIFFDEHRPVFNKGLTVDPESCDVTVILEGIR
jgi:hypothetical protein